MEIIENIKNKNNFEKKYIYESLSIENENGKNKEQKKYIKKYESINKSLFLNESTDAICNIKKTLGTFFFIYLQSMYYTTTKKIDGVLWAIEQELKHYQKDFLKHAAEEFLCRNNRFYYTEYKVLCDFINTI